jgi:chemotaxis protein histidine kinase CheA
MAQTLNAQRFERLTAQRQMGKPGRRANAPAVREETDRRACQPQLARPAVEAVEEIFETVRGSQTCLKVQKTVEQAFVIAGLLHQQRHVLFELIDVVARARHVPFNQRHGLANRMRHAHPFDDACIADKKLRIVQQVIHNGAVVQLRYRFPQFFPWLLHRWINPS